MRGLARDLCETLAALARNPEALVAIAIAGVLLSGCGIFDRTTTRNSFEELRSAQMTKRLCDAGADTAECRK